MPCDLPRPGARTLCSDRTPGAEAGGAPQDRAIRRTDPRRERRPLDSAPQPVAHSGRPAGTTIEQEIHEKCLEDPAILVTANKWLKRSFIRSTIDLHQTPPGLP